MDRMVGPEEQARVKIDNLLATAGWVLQDRDRMDRNAGLGVAVREFPLPAGTCDYLLFVEGKAAGVVEAKKAGVTLSGVAEQSEKYMANLPDHLAPDTIALEDGFTRDVRNVGHFGTGDLEVTLKSHDDLERAKSLIVQSYEAS